MFDINTCTERLGALHRKPILIAKGENTISSCLHWMHPPTGVWLLHFKSMGQNDPRSQFARVILQI